MTDTGRIPEAISHYKKALQIKPWSPHALCNLVHTYIFMADWKDYEINMKLLEHCLDSQLAHPSQADPLPAIQPFHAFVYPIDLLKVKALAVAYAKRAEAVATSLVACRPIASPGGPPYTHPAPDPLAGLAGHTRLRVGYVSSDFANHPLAHLMQSALCFHDRSTIEIFCYSLRPSDSSVHRVMIEEGVELDEAVVLAGAGWHWVMLCSPVSRKQTDGGWCSMTSELAVRAMDSQGVTKQTHLSSWLKI